MTNCHRTHATRKNVATCVGKNRKKVIVTVSPKQHASHSTSETAIRHLPTALHYPCPAGLEKFVCFPGKFRP